MPGKANDWDNADFLLDLVVGLYTGAQVNKGLTPAIKDSIEEYLKSREWKTSFDAVRIMAKRQVMVWDANVHEDILISLFQHIKPSSEDWSNVMKDLQGKGYSFTEGALRQHVQKLRKNRDTAVIQNAGSETATPRKPRAAAPKTPKRAPKRKAPTKSASIADDDEDDLEDMKLQLKMETDIGDDEILSPKGPKRARTATPKAEPEADEDLDSSKI